MAEDCKKDLSLSKLMGSENYHDFFCQPCDVDGSNVEARSFCEQCEEYLCTDCASYHRKQKQMRDHVLQDLQQMSNKPPISKKNPTSTHTNRCNDHTGKPMEYVCVNHITVGCQVCMTLDHSACKKTYIPELSKGFADSPTYKVFRADVKETLENLNKQSQTLLSGIDKQQTMLNNEHSETKSMVKVERAHIDLMLDKWEKDMYHELELSRKLTETSLSRAAVMVKHIASQYTLMACQFDSLQQSGQDTNLYIAAVNYQESEDVKSLDARMASAATNIPVSRPVFRPNKSLLKTVGKLESLVSHEIQDIDIEHAYEATDSDNDDGENDISVEDQATGVNEAVNKPQASATCVNIKCV